ncbi:MAG: SMI1/KNR4 family protein [Ruminococcus sp.]|nr:SMI1/KNR4 family protein [Ruminococcus sp.]
MKDHTIDPVIIECFDTIKNFCELISEDRDSEFGEPMTMEQIQAWEAENGFVLPDQMKSWYLLTSSAYIANGYYEIFEPFVGCYEKDDDVVVFASIIGEEGDSSAED